MWISKVSDNMTKKLPYKQNKAGIWIDTKTGRFARKADYQPYAERKLSASIKKSEGLKAYWKDVKAIQDLTGYDTKTARKYLSQSPKYLAKKGKKPFQWKDFWKDVNKQKLDKQARDNYKKQLEDEDFELVSY